MKNIKKGNSNRHLTVYKIHAYLSKLIQIGDNNNEAENIIWQAAVRRIKKIEKNEKKNEIKIKKFGKTN